LYRTALRKIVNRHEYYQAAKRDVRRETPLADSNEILTAYRSLCTPSQEVSANEQIGHIEAAFDSLPEHYREVIVGSRLLGLSHADLAAQSGKTESAVRTMLSRALAQLAYEIDRA
jgi:RNA polymerase sigma factor (sigma-70 family)